MILIQCSAIDLKKGDKVEVFGKVLTVATKRTTSNGQYIALNDDQGFTVKELMVKDFEQFSLVSEAAIVDYSHPQIAEGFEYALGLEMHGDVFSFDSVGFFAQDSEFEQAQELKQAA